MEVDYTTQEQLKKSLGISKVVVLVSLKLSLQMLRISSSSVTLVCKYFERYRI
ncbi:hypothetical protein Leryth_010208, partial [Lithospermum erythrorhizon]